MHVVPDAARSETLLRTLVMCDLVESTALIERLGDVEGTELLRRQDRLARNAMQRWAGQEIDRTDGFLVMFDRAISAVAFALEYQRELRALGEDAGEPLRARVGIQVGEVLVWENSPSDVARGAKLLEVEGLPVSIAARLAGLALPGQILLTGTAQELAQRAEREAHLQTPNLAWVSHGLYRFKGVPKPVPVFEVGEVGVAPLRAPSDTAKAWKIQPWWRTRSAIALVSAGLLTVAGASLYVSTHTEPQLAFGERDWVVIGDLVDVNGDKQLDEALSTAFRIGLEQSRFVNVVPDAQVRQALARMQRKGTTRIDRDVACEIALREQARAVIVPSVAQYGGKVRISAELIDPNGARTVSTQTVDAGDTNEVLPAVDRLLRELRTNLGESLKQVQSDSQPLQKVTTSNLEALRVYSQAVQELRQGDYEQARALFVYATELDTGFAAAYAGMGSVLFTMERYPEARAALEKAVSMADRITERERLFARGLLARFADPESMLNVWRAYAKLYPEYGLGQNNIGYASYRFVHDYGLAETALREASHKRVPLPNFTLHTLGHVLLAEDKIADAEQQFRAALALSPAAGIFGLADALVAQQRFDAAAQYLEQAPRQAPGTEVDRGMHRATLLIAQGEIGQAAATVDAVLPEAARLPSPNARWRAQAAAIALRVARGETTDARDLARRHLAELLSKAAQTDANLEAMEQLLYAAGWAARLGLVGPARDALALAKEHGHLDRWPVRAQLGAIAQAEVDLAAGHADAVRNRLQSTNEGRELWETHELRARVMRALGDTSGEAVELRWLTGHPGLAYAQWTDQLLGAQARAIAIGEAAARLAKSGEQR
jgi:putative peptide modification system cyclase